MGSSSVVKALEEPGRKEIERERVRERQRDRRTEGWGRQPSRNYHQVPELGRGWADPFGKKVKLGARPAGPDWMFLGESPRCPVCSWSPHDHSPRSCWFKVTQHDLGPRVCTSSSGNSGLARVRWDRSERGWSRESCLRLRRAYMVY